MFQKSTDNANNLYSRGSMEPQLDNFRDIYRAHWPGDGVYVTVMNKIQRLLIFELWPSKLKKSAMALGCIPSSKTFKKESLRRNIRYTAFAELYRHIIA